MQLSSSHVLEIQYKLELDEVDSAVYYILIFRISTIPRISGGEQAVFGSCLLAQCMIVQNICR